MVQISDTSVAELSVAIPLVLGALAMCLVRTIAQTEQSRCTRLDCLCCHLVREPPPAAAAAEDVNVAVAADAVGRV